MFEKWTSRYGFVSSTVSSIIGIISLTFLPNQIKKYKLQFLIFYFLFSIFLGIPLTLLELSIGQKFQSKPILAMVKINKRLAGVGVVSFILSFILSGYFLANIIWALKYISASLNLTLEFKNKPKYFYSDIAYFTDSNNNNISIDGSSFYYLIGLMFFCYYFISRGLKYIESISKILFPSCILVIITLIISQIITFKGSIDGINDYLFTFSDFSIFDFDLISNALILSVFSVHCGVGILITYSSTLNKHQNTVLDSILIIVSKLIIDMLVLILFSISMQYKQSNTELLPYDFLKDRDQIFGLFPIVFSYLKSPHIYIIIFYIMFISLAFLCLISLIINTFSIYDFVKLKINKETYLKLILIMLFIFSIFFLMDFSELFVFHIENSITEFLGLTMILSECIAISWIYDQKFVISKIGSISFYSLLIGWFLSLNLAYLISFYCSLLIGSLTGFGILLAFSIFSYLKAKEPIDSNKFNYVFIGNCERYRFEMNLFYRYNKKWKIPIIWCFMIRILIPSIIYLVVLNKLFNLIIDKNMIVSSISTVLLSIGVILFFALFPKSVKYNFRRSNINKIGIE